MTPIDISKFEQLRATGELPSPKGAALAIVRLTQKEDVPLAELAKAIGADPAFAGRLIKAANSAQAAGRRPVASISDALSVLGISTVRTLALGFSLLSNYSAGKCQKFDYDRFWSHSLVCGLAFQALMQRTRAAVADEAFCVGLLARVGSLALATIFPEDYSRLISETEGKGPNALLSAEEGAFALTHGQLSAAMLEDWGIPKVFTEPVLFHETPEQSRFEEGTRPHHLTMAMAISEQVADICLAPESEWRGMMPQLFMLGSRLSVDAESMMAICDKVAKEWQEWGALLKVHAKEMPPFAEMSKPPAPPQLTEGMLLKGGEDGYRMRVLVVDDDRSMRTLLAAMLKDVGHEVFEAENGKQAFDTALEVRPEMMIVDWMMPEMNGVELTRALRETVSGRGVYILILTALEDDEALVEAFEAGVDDFMIKPLKPRILAARLRAGQRVVKLQQEVERDREEIRRFAAELAVTNRKLQQVALTDFLTGFPNRRYAMARLQQDWAATTRNNRALSCLVIDLDSFKQVNDTHGHDVGDQVLKQSAQAIKAALRAEDVICRMGGDEFLAICPDTDLDAAMLCAERVRAAVAALRIPIASTELTGSVSIGVAQRVSSMANLDMLIKRADEGVYLAKSQGRNRVVSAQLPAAEDKA
ncbi:MAG: diguanylate cyclase [Rhodocyclaceae bacterium]|nr:MAG: diguanylate cyclase [Rhodocyclaceae bacterium]